VWFIRRRDGVVKCPLVGVAVINVDLLRRFPANEPPTVDGFDTGRDRCDDTVNGQDIHWHCW